MPTAAPYSTTKTARRDRAPATSRTKAHAPAPASTDTPDKIAKPAAKARAPGKTKALGNYMDLAPNTPATSREPAASPSSGSPAVPRKRKPKASVDERPVAPPAPSTHAGHGHGATAHRKRPAPASNNDDASASDDESSSDSGAHQPARSRQPEAATSDNHAVPRKRKPMASSSSDEGDSDDDHAAPLLQNPTKSACARPARAATDAGSDFASDSGSDADFDAVPPPQKSRASAKARPNQHVISLDPSSEEEEEEAQEDHSRDDLRRQHRSRQPVLRKTAAPGDHDGVGFPDNDHLAQFYQGIDPKLIYVKVEYDDRKDASEKYKLIWDKCNTCWCVSSRCMQFLPCFFYCRRVFGDRSRLISCVRSGLVFFFFPPGQSLRSCWLRTRPS